MAREPCEKCGRPFFGRSSYAYPTLYDDGSKDSRRLRLCPPCMSEYYQWLMRRTEEWNKDGTSGADIQLCAYSEEHDLEVPSRAAFFVTLYPRKDERADFACGACFAHVSRLATESLVRPL